MKNVVERSSGVLDVGAYTERIYQELLDITNGTMRRSISIIADELRPSIHEVDQSLQAMRDGVLEISEAATALQETVRTQRELSGRVLERFEAIRNGTQGGVRRLQTLDEGLTALSENSSAVRQMLDSVENISGQLNVISINGSIQASHTGKVAAGFKVIAGEMKQMTAKVAALADQQRERIERILGDIRQASDESARITRELSLNSESLDDAVSLTGELTDELDTVASSSQQLSATVTEFSAGIEELSATFRRLSENIESFHDDLEQEARLNSWAVDIAQTFPSIADRSESFEEAAQQMMQHLYAQLLGSDGEPVVVLARVFLLLSYEELPPAYQEALVQQKTQKVLCLVGTAGREPAWNEVAGSIHHKHIVLPRTAEELSLMPMLAASFEKMGISYAQLTEGSTGATGIVEDYLLVGEARGSSLIPAQSGFVEPYGVESLLGVGGVLPSGRVFTSFIFTNTPMTDRVADRLRILPATLQRCLANFDERDRIWR